MVNTSILYIWGRSELKKTVTLQTSCLWPRECVCVCVRCALYFLLVAFTNRYVCRVDGRYARLRHRLSFAQQNWCGTERMRSVQIQTKCFLMEPIVIFFQTGTWYNPYLANTVGSELNQADRTNTHKLQLVHCGVLVKKPQATYEIDVFLLA